MNTKNKNKLNVFVGDNQAGILMNDEGQFTFQYTTFETSPLSLTLPVRSEPYPDSIAREYFSNLLPEGKARDHITRQLKLPPEDDFVLLYAIGRECAGAVSLIPPDEDFALEYEYEEMDEERLYEVIKHLPMFPAAANDKKVKLSLAGAQSKLAIFLNQNGYKLPINGAPSTHIIKKSMDNDIYPSSVQNEAFVMSLAKEIGLNVPKAEMVVIKGMPFYIIERYDRKLTENGIVRYVQEDFCQATRTPSTCKYQDQGGPGLAECYQIIVQHSIDIITDTEQFLKLLAYNILIGNHDAHAKNISLLHTPEGIRLAPFYDIVSTQVYPALDDNLAMRVNNKARISDISEDDFKCLARSLDLSYKVVEKINAEVASVAYEKSKSQQASFAATYGPCEIIDNIVELIAKNRDALS